MNPPLKITIATVTYNAAALIERTIASVEAQDYPYVQHVIVDGTPRTIPSKPFTITKNVTAWQRNRAKSTASANPTKDCTMQ